MSDTNSDNNLLPQKEYTPLDGAVLIQWLQAFKKIQNEQTALLKSIRGMIQFFVILVIISIILGACSIILSF